MQQTTHMHSIHHDVLAVVNLHVVLEHCGTGSEPASQQTPWRSAMMKSAASSSIEHNVRHVYVQTAGLLTVHHRYNSAFPAQVLVSSMTYRLRHHSRMFGWATAGY